jgi:TolB protein
MKTLAVFVLFLTFILNACSHTSVDKGLLFPSEARHLRNIRQLSFGGQNAEAYFSPDGNHLIFQSQRGGSKCDEEFIMDLDGSNVQKVSNGQGRVTCGYFIGEDQFLFASTFAADKNCPAMPDFSKGYVWPMYPSYEIYKGSLKMPGTLQPLTHNNAYDAEATVSDDQKQIVFTSDRSGDLDLYIMNTNGKDVRRVTHDLGYDGGAYFTHDGKRLIYRAFHPETAQEKVQYKTDLKNHLYRPSWLELFMIDVDGKNRRQITNLHSASFAPYMFPSDKRVIFASNRRDPRGRHFDLYAIDIDGKNLEQITFSNTFDAFPMFSPDGKKLVWASNRNAKVPHETNIFIADWVE